MITRVTSLMSILGSINVTYSDVQRRYIQLYDTYSDIQRPNELEKERRNIHVLSVERPLSIHLLRDRPPKTRQM